MVAFLVMVREGFEAALVVALVFAYLRRIGRLDLGRWVWAGGLVAVGLAAATGLVVRLTLGTLAGPARVRAFAAISVVAVGVLTWMVLWMRRHAGEVRPHLEAGVERALGSRRVGLGVALVAFWAMLREAIEAALFLLALSDATDGARLLAGATAGLVVAAVLGLLVYLGGRRLPLRAFFTVTGLVLITFAAGLAARSVQLLQAAGDLGSFNLNGVYDLRSIPWLTTRTEVGRFLAAMFGWDPRPSIEQVVVWLGYLTAVGAWFLRPTRPARAG